MYRTIFEPGIFVGPRSLNPLNLNSLLKIPNFPPIFEFVHIIVFGLIGKLTFLLYFIICIPFIFLSVIRIAFGIT